MGVGTTEIPIVHLQLEPEDRPERSEDREFTVDGGQSQGRTQEDDREVRAAGEVYSVAEHSKPGVQAIKYPNKTTEQKSIG